MISMIQGALLAFQILCGVGIGYWLQQKFGVDGSFLSQFLCAIAGFAIAFTFQFFFLGIGFILSRLFGDRISNKTYIASYSEIVNAWWHESLRSIQVFSWLQVFAANKPYPITEKNDKAPVVLLIHGFFCNRGMWHPFARWLNSLGYACEGISLEPVWGSIDQYPEQVKAGVDRLLKSFPDRPIVLIGHSMGGLAIRSFLRKYPDVPIDHAISLGTPHQGTWLSRLTLGKNVRQMGRHSTWLADLSANESARHLPPFTVILSNADNIVFPQSDQTFRSAQVERIRGAGHLHLVFHPEVQRLIAEILKNLR